MTKKERFSTRGEKHRTLLSFIPAFQFLRQSSRKKEIQNTNLVGRVGVSDIWTGVLCIGYEYYKLHAKRQRGKSKKGLPKMVHYSMLPCF